MRDHFMHLYCLAPAEVVDLFKENTVSGLPDGGVVRAVVCGRMAAVVSSVPAKTYSNESLE